MSDQLHLNALQNLTIAVNKIVQALGNIPLSTANGGTGTTTTFTLGSVVFAGTDGVYTQDNSHFFWDDTNNRLGIGTTGPLGPLQVGTRAGGEPTYRGDIIISQAGAAEAGNGGLEFKPDAGSSGYGNRILSVFDGGSAYDLRFQSRTNSASWSTRMTMTASGNVGIGTTGAVNTLQVAGSIGWGAPVTKTNDFTLGATENWVINNRAATNTVTLPAASSSTGRVVTMSTIQAQTVVSASSNVVPLVGGSAATAILAATAGKWATLVSDGSNWVIMAGN